MSGAIVLASKSLARRAVLEAAGVRIEVADAGVDEEALKARLLARGAAPKAIAEALAAEKAAVAARGRPGFVVGADQTLELEGRLYDKVATRDAARARLKLLRGRAHQLHAAVAVARQGEVVWREAATATLVMRDFSDAFLEDYLAREGAAALGSVGCYRLEGPGVQLFARIEGDYFSILGLPLLGLLEFLRREGALSA
ncbi:MAG TPA: Maf family protein [Phenylobacterium sp.]|uniref:Maf family protein n=1 Tax=Phenylobacterium sp. TaxID=1871053 RepID=UPI002C717BC5|nr:Maf family protein [Phenylobacterium sp.]HSV02225.1 Maf family protein [Phenylobacterium sp.]